MERFDFVNRANADYIDRLYDQYQRDPRSLDLTWQAYFSGFEYASGRNLRPAPAPAAAGKSPGDNGNGTAEARRQANAQAQAPAPGGGGTGAGGGNAPGAAAARPGLSGNP